MVDIQSISKGLSLGDDGIWFSQDNQDISYPAEGNEVFFSIEDNSFWFRHRNNCIQSVVKSYPPAESGAIFDIGGGNGFVSLGLSNEGFDVVLVEPGRIGVNNAKNRGLKNVICATTDTAKFMPHTLPAVGLFDIIEHIEDDLAFLKSINNLISQESYLYVTVPAYRFLWSEEDDLAGHFRRYTVEEICSVLKSAGFNIVFASKIFRFLPIAIFFLRALPYKLGLSKLSKHKQNIDRDHVVKKGFLGSLLKSILRPEIKYLENKKSMRFGSSCLIVAKSSGNFTNSDSKELNI